MQKYPRGSRGSPAKGVVWEDCSAGSNPAFGAKKEQVKRPVLFWRRKTDVKVPRITRGVRARRQNGEREISKKLVFADDAPLRSNGMPPSVKRPVLFWRGGLEELAITRGTSCPLSRPLIMVGRGESSERICRARTATKGGDYLMPPATAQGERYRIINSDTPSLALWEGIAFIERSCAVGKYATFCAWP